MIDILVYNGIEDGSHEHADPAENVDGWED